MHAYFNLLWHAGYLMHLGAAWVYIGELRFRLLLSSYNPDPAFESAFMHSHILEKISLLELEGKVNGLLFLGCIMNELTCYIECCGM